MAFEMPLDQIKQLQILLRKDANLSWYDTEKNDQLSLPKLPSVAETVANLDPSPPYLRCKNCDGRLLRGVQSSICVFCGANPHKDLPPEPIKFKDTLGYKWLLDSLQLDGSEMVAPMEEEENSSSRRRSESKDEIPLSELLDLEIRWPSEEERTLSSNSDSEAFQGKSSLSLAGVDLDGFFDHRESDSNASGQTMAFGDQVGDTASYSAVQAGENLSLFQNVQASELATPTRSMEDQSDDSFSGWAANFRSASSGPVNEEPESSFGHSKVQDTVSGSSKDDFNHSVSKGNDWFQVDGWRTSNLEVPNQSGKPELNVDFNDTKTAESATSSSTRNLDWMQDDQWQRSDNKTTAAVVTEAVEYSFDGWNDFTGSARASAQDPSSIISRSNITEQVGKSEITADLNNTKAEGNSSSIEDFSWMQDDIWPGSNNKTTDTKSTNNVEDSFDDWNDFSGSANAQYLPSNLSNSKITGESGKSELAKNNDDKRIAGGDSGSSRNFDWMQDDQQLVSNNQASDVVTTNEDADSFDNWNDLTGSPVTQNPSNSVLYSETNILAGKSETSVDAHQTKTEVGNSSSIEDFNWMQDDGWPSGNNKTTDAKGTNEDADSFDDWNDFAGLANAQHLSSNLSNSKITGESGKSELAKNNDDKRIAGGDSGSPRNFDWMQANQWQGSNDQASGIVTTNEGADSFDDWNDFTGSPVTQNPSGSVSYSEINVLAGKSGTSADCHQTKTEVGNSSSIEDFSWMQDEGWPGSNNKTTNTKGANEDADSFDDWNDFTGSANAQNLSSNLSNSEIKGETGKSDFAMDNDDKKISEGASGASRNFEWMNDDQWQGSNNQASGIVTTNDDADSADDWNEFTGSSLAQNPSNSVSYSEINALAGKSETSADSHQTKTEVGNSSSIDDFSWMQDGGWPDSHNKTTDTKGANEDADSFDDWNDFTGSANAQISSSNPSNSETTGKTGKSEFAKDSDDKRIAVGASGSSSFDWMKDDQWKGSHNQASGIATSNEGADSFDDWNDFTGSTVTQNPSSSVSYSEINVLAGKSETSADCHQTKTEVGNSSSIEDFSWMQDEGWPGKNNKTTDTKGANEDADSFDDWNDFIGSANAQYSSKNIDWKQDNQWQGSQNQASGILTANEGADSFDDWNDFTGSSVTQHPSSNASYSGQSVASDFHQIKKQVGANSSVQLQSFDWMQNDLCPVSQKKSNDPKTTNVVSDSFDDIWNGFKQKATTRDSSGTISIPVQTSSEQSSVLNLFSSSNKSHSVNF
ncbi:Dentin sialophosphoprotein, putative [Arachis hypogaea]|nr:Dentin sialophosphoprotein, putative [Arachis hypogaea]